MVWPSKSPDSNIIEFLWDGLDRAIRENASKKINHLFDCLQKSWELITLEQIKKISIRMTRVCQTIMTAKGGYFNESKI